MTILLSSAKTIFMKGNINMQKQKRITLNADKRKVIADVFQDHFESNSKYQNNLLTQKKLTTICENKQKLKSINL